MKFKVIGNICKKKKTAIIFNRVTVNSAGMEVHQQYISDGSVIYPVIGLPNIDEEILLNMWDIPEKQRDSWAVNSLPTPDFIDFRDTIAVDSQVKETDFVLYHNQSKLRAIETSRGIVFIDLGYLAPLADSFDVMQMYERISDDGQLYIVVTAGLWLQAIVFPYKLIDEDFIKKLGYILDGCKNAFVWQKSIEEKSPQAQLHWIRVDPETGEEFGEE